MKTILGLDLGTNSIGWALVKAKHDEKLGEITAMGARIIPMTQDVIDEFGKGITKSGTSERTRYRSVRRLLQRDLLRRERLHRTLNVLGFLPEHYANEIDFIKHPGQFKAESEPLLAYKKNEYGKHQFIFMNSFNEMLEDFKKARPELFYIKKNGKETKIPLDWTIYYLRKKALTEKISKEELAWLLLNFNQKRGYYQLRGEDEETKENKSEEFHSLKVVDVVDSGDRKGSDVWYNVVLENGWIYRRSSRIPLFDWVGTVRDFIVSADLNEDGTIKVDKDGKEKRSFRAPKDDDWTLIKKKTEFEILNSRKTVGCFIYDSLLNNPIQKIRGKLVRTVERHFYKQELEGILKKQLEFHPELQNRNLYTACIEELYPNNEAHKRNIQEKGLDHLFINDIIFYQRPLKSKVSQISDCPFESRSFLKEGKHEISALKCIAKSHPLFQEFRLLQFIKNLKIYQKTFQEDIDVTDRFLNTDSAYTLLFNWLNDKFEINQESLIKYLLSTSNLKGAALKNEIARYRWNYIEDKTYPGNETRGSFLQKIAKIEGIDASFLTARNTEGLWHILYSVTDKLQLNTALKRFGSKHKLPVEFAVNFSKIKPYDKDYGSFSAKALKKLLPLMRFGEAWEKEAIDRKTLDRIERIINAEYDEHIKQRVREKAIHINCISDCQGLPLWLASYIVYDRHSEASDLAKWESPNDLNVFLKEFRQHSLRNPIVEQIILETLRVVRDIWMEFGEGKKDFFDEIHIELGRDMKNPAEKRKRLTEQVSANENTNLRIKALLTELKEDGVKDVRPYSPSQQELLKIYEEGVYQSEVRKERLDDIEKIRKSSKPSRAEIIRYKLWLEQGYISPYTRRVIPLSELFSIKYQVEHIFPQARYFDDSLSNKVICEAEVNHLKGNKTSYEFIKNPELRIVQLNGGGTVEILSIQDYESHIQQYFSRNKTKLKNLLSEEVPDGFIHRQMNDSRYISKVVKTLLSKIVREDNEGELEQEVTSKNVIPVTGAITNQMKQDWGLNNVWNELVTPRFERMNQLTGTNDYGQWENKEGKRVFQTAVPDSMAKGFSKKRIDHRHHALDALVIACVTRNHINYLNNLNAKSEDDKSVKQNLRGTLCIKRKMNGDGNYKWEFIKPWERFTQETKDHLLKTVISFKQNSRVINKTNNRFQRWLPDENGAMKKVIEIQTQGQNWAIRKPLHKETVYGKVILRREKPNPVSLVSVLDQLNIIVDVRIKQLVKEMSESLQGDLVRMKKALKVTPLTIGETVIDKVQVYEFINGTASRTLLNSSFNQKKIESITDTGIQKILTDHLNQARYQNQKDDSGKFIAAEELAFSDAGLEDLNSNLSNHKPIYKVRIYEEGNRFAVGQTGNKKDKYVEAAKGTNLFFAIYADPNGKRSYISVPLNEVIESQKQGLPIAPETDLNGNKLLFTLSPNDLVYVPTIEEQSNPGMVNFKALTVEQVNRIYKLVSFSGNQAFFVLSSVAKTIADKMEFSVLNKMEKDLNGQMIKATCLKINVNRLGNVKPK